MRELTKAALAVAAVCVGAPFAQAADQSSAISAPAPASVQAALPSVPGMSQLAGLMNFKNWQCVTFARAFSGLQIFGDAWTWWEKASGKYARGSTPEAKSVLVFKPKGSMSRGHVAVVDQVLTERVIQITHANWSPINGRRGQVEKDVTVVDVSPANNWSEVKVWYGPMQNLGGGTYPTYGFIYQPNTPAGGLQQASWSVAD